VPGTREQLRKLVHFKDDLLAIAHLVNKQDSQGLCSQAIE
jgi:hypothetical protein